VDGTREPDRKIKQESFKFFRVEGEKTRANRKGGMTSREKNRKRERDLEILGSGPPSSCNLANVGADSGVGKGDNKTKNGGHVGRGTENATHGSAGNGKVTTSRCIHLDKEENHPCVAFYRRAGTY